MLGLQADYEFTICECKFIIGVNTLPSGHDSARERMAHLPYVEAAGAVFSPPQHGIVTSPQRYAARALTAGDCPLKRGSPSRGHPRKPGLQHFLKRVLLGSEAGGIMGRERPRVYLLRASKESQVPFFSRAAIEPPGVVPA